MTPSAWWIITSSGRFFAAALKSYNNIFTNTFFTYKNIILLIKIIKTNASMIMLLVNITQNHDLPYIFFISFFIWKHVYSWLYKNVLQMVFHVCFEKKYRNKKNLTHMIHWLCFRNP